MTKAFATVAVGLRKSMQKRHHFRKRFDPARNGEKNIIFTFNHNNSIKKTCSTVLPRKIRQQAEHGFKICYSETRASFTAIPIISPLGASTNLDA